MPKIKGIFGANLRKYREIRGLTQKELAIRLEVTPQTVNNWENGRQWLADETVLLLAQTLGIEESDLFQTGEPPKPVEIKHTPADCVFAAHEFWKSCGQKALRKFVEDSRKKGS